MAEVEEAVTFVQLNWSWLALIIPLFPILAVFGILLLRALNIKFRDGYPIALVGTGLSLILTAVLALEAVMTLLQGKQFQDTYSYFTWIKVGDIDITFGVLVDPLSVFMLSLVALVAFLVVVYSIEYMAHDSSHRYYAEICLFSGAMMALAVSSNFILFFLAWEILGWMSYALIGYFVYKKVPLHPNDPGRPHPAWASLKAFLMTKFGDVLLFIGIILLFLEVKSFDFLAIQEALKTHSMDPNMALLIGILIFGGAVGKSAQVPLHTWLPDAMAGPTTVSTLIHSATMVKAGIFLVARMSFYFDYAVTIGSPETLLIVAVIGGITAFMAATMALVNTDIKGILAYSTISQLAYMTIAVGIGSPALAMFHILSHGTFKALLFLSAGSVIHGTGTQDIREMGGLWNDMRKTAVLMGIGAAALSGLFPFNGFFSKDAIILESFRKATEVMVHDSTLGTLYFVVFLSALVTAFLTAIYSWRLWFVTFGGSHMRKEGHPHESSWIMLGPMTVLAAIVVLVGIIATPGLLFGDFSMEHFFIKVIDEPMLGAREAPSDFLFGQIHWLTILSFVLAYGGFFLAMLIYKPGPASVSYEDRKAFYFSFPTKESLSSTFVDLQRLARDGVYYPLKKLMFLQRLFENEYYIDTKLYYPLSAWFYRGFCGLMRWIDENIVDGLVRAVGYGAFVACGAARWFDDHVIDGIVNAFKPVFVYLSDKVRQTSTGVVENYGLIMLTGVFLVLTVLFYFVTA